jgi:hypothetical protein
MLSLFSFSDQLYDPSLDNKAAAFFARNDSAFVKYAHSWETCGLMNFYKNSE